MSPQSMEETFDEDIYEDWEQAILQTLQNSPLKVSMFLSKSRLHLASDILYLKEVKEILI